MRAFFLIRRHIRVEDMPQSTLPTQHPPGEGLLVHRSHTALRQGMHLGSARRQLHTRDACIVHDLFASGTALRLAVMAQGLSGLQAPHASIVTWRALCLIQTSWGWG